MTKQTSNKFSPEVRERAVRMVFDHQTEHASHWVTITSIASKIGCNPETLRSWVRQAERDEGKRAGLTTDGRERIKALEREVRELRQANEILGRASASVRQGASVLRIHRTWCGAWIDAASRSWLQLHVRCNRPLKAAGMTGCGTPRAALAGIPSRRA
jgi:transposase